MPKLEHVYLHSDFLKEELREINQDYKALSWYKRFWFRLWSWSLASKLANINPEKTTVEDVLELRDLYQGT